MAYLKDLSWQKEFKYFTDAERKVMLALSNEKFRWRTKERLLAVSGLEDEAVEEALANLIHRDKVRASISKRKNLIYGLRERVG